MASNQLGPRRESMQSPAAQDSFADTVHGSNARLPSDESSLWRQTATIDVLRECLGSFSIKMPKAISHLREAYSRAEGGELELLVSSLMPDLQRRGALVAGEYEKLEMLTIVAHVFEAAVGDSYRAVMAHLDKTRLFNPDRKERIQVLGACAIQQVRESLDNQYLRESRGHSRSRAFKAAIETQPLVEGLSTKDRQVLHGDHHNRRGGDRHPRGPWKRPWTGSK